MCDLTSVAAAFRRPRCDRLSGLFTFTVLQVPVQGVTVCTVCTVCTVLPKRAGIEY